MAVMVALLVLVGLLSLPAAQAGFWASQGYNENWVSGHGTWYGDPYGEGSNGMCLQASSQVALACFS
jgi:hypothetical protein